MSSKFVSHSTTEEFGYVTKQSCDVTSIKTCFQHMHVRACIGLSTYVRAYLRGNVGWRNWSKLNGFGTCCCGIMGGLELAGEADEVLKCMRFGEAKYDDMLGNALCAPCLRVTRGCQCLALQRDMLSIWRFTHGECVQLTIKMMTPVIAECMVCIFSLLTVKPATQNCSQMTLCLALLLGSAPPRSRHLRWDYEARLWLAMMLPLIESPWCHALLVFLNQIPVLRTGCPPASARSAHRSEFHFIVTTSTDRQRHRECEKACKVSGGMRWGDQARSCEGPAWTGRFPWLRQLGISAWLRPWEESPALQIHLGNRLLRNVALVFGTCTHAADG